MKDKTLCEFPLCTRKAVREGFCVNHAKFFAGPKPQKVKNKIPYRSDKRIKDQKVYNKIVNEMISENPDCEIKSPVCIGKAQGLDHTQKRSPSNLLNRKNLKRSCNPCQDFKEKFPGWAKENNHSISRFKKVV